MSPIRLTGIEKDLEFKDLVDIAGFSRLLTRFCKATGVANALVGTDGEIISQAGWVDACTRFHRANPGTLLRCQESEQKLVKNLGSGEVACSNCKNGLIDYATPVVIEGQQLATLFLGQVLNGPPDMAFFREQATRFGFDEAKYIEAIRRVPIVDKTRMETLMACMVEMAQMLAASGVARLRQTVLAHELDQSIEQRIQMEDLLRFTPVGIGWTDANGKIEYLNQRFTDLFGYTQDDISDLGTLYGKTVSDPHDQQTVIDPQHQLVMRAGQTSTMPPDLETSFVCKDQSVRRVLIQLASVGGKLLSTFSDMTAYWQSEQRNRVHNKMLEMVAKGEPLFDILHTMVLAIESETPATTCSVRLMDKDGKHLSTCIAPNLPAFFIDALNALEIGKGAGSCGTAARRGERVIVPDIRSNEYWHPIHALAHRIGLAACWSEPIISSSGELLGTFAIYHAEPAIPGPTDIDRLCFAANLAAVAIENRNTREQLVKRERAFRTLAENAPDNITRHDRNGHMIYHNPQLERTLGIPSEKMLGKRVSELGDDRFFSLYEEKIFHVLKTGAETLLEISVPTPMGMTYHSIHMVAERDESGAITGVLSIGRDFTEHKHMEEELERQAHSDPLTGLANRRHFIQQAQNEVGRIDRYGGALSLLMFDVDHFKRINDTYGHNVGDLALQKVAATSRATMREIDIIGRIGGEEFVVLLPQTVSVQAVDAAQRLRIAIAESKITLENGNSLQFTASFGVTTISGKSIGIDELLKRCDAAMYRAKESGRNRVCIDSIR